MKCLSSPSSPDADVLISIVMLIFFAVFQSHWPLPLYLGGPFLNLSGYSWCGCRQDSSLVRLKRLSSYMLHPPVTLTSLGFLQSRGLPLDSCTPSVLMFVKSLKPKQTLISDCLPRNWVSALELVLLRRIWSDNSASLPRQSSWWERRGAGKQLK